jgi:putative radical SAM enzyme (TIGR03279 family)
MADVTTTQPIVDATTQPRMSFPVTEIASAQAPVDPPSAAPAIVSVIPGSAAQRAGLQPGDEILLVNGQVVRDIIQWRLAVDDADVDLVIRRGGLELDVLVAKAAGEALGAEINSALFDQMRTCDNHCSFCFIYQLPQGMRPSLYQKDDDYRLSFLYGNFTTLTRFTEADLERVVTEGLSPLNVSIHATHPDRRSELLRNRRGAGSLRWLRAMLDEGIEVHGQLVVCPGLNDGDVLDETLAGVLDRFPELASIHAVPLGISKFNKEVALRLHTYEEACAVVDTVERWQSVFLDVLGRRMVFAADEYYLMTGRPFPPNEAYEEFCQYENGVGMVRTFERELTGDAEAGPGVADGFFAWVEGRTDSGEAKSPLGATAGTPLAGAVRAGAPLDGYRAPRTDAEPATVGVAVGLTPRRSAPIAILTGEYGAAVLPTLLAPVLDEFGRSLSPDDVRILTVTNDFFGGNTAVAGLMTGADVTRVLAQQPQGHRYLLPDVCLSRGIFLDGMRADELPRAVEVIKTDGVALRAALAVGTRKGVPA